MLVTGNDTNWQRDRIWQFQMLQAFNNNPKCPFLVLTKLWEDPRKLLNLLTLLRVMTIVVSETNWFVRPHWVWHNFWYLFWYLFWRYFLKLPDIESDVTSDIWSDMPSSILSGIYSDIAPDCKLTSDILSHKSDNAYWHDIWLGSGIALCNLNVQLCQRQGGEGERRSGNNTHKNKLKHHTKFWLDKWGNLP